MKTLNTTVLKTSLISALLVLSSISTSARADHDSERDSIIPLLAVGVIASILSHQSHAYHYKKKRVYGHQRQHRHARKYGHRQHYTSSHRKHHKRLKRRHSFSDDGYRFERKWKRHD